MKVAMSPAALDERARLRELYSLRILDTPAEERFDQHTRLVADILGVPTVLISLVDENRQWFKSSVGIDAEETPRDLSFCAHALPVDFLEIPDAREDPRFRDNPLVTGPPFIRFYAGAVLHGPTGAALGTLCILDNQPRRLTDNEQTRLIAFAGLVEQELNRHERFKILAPDLAQAAFYDPVTGLPERGPIKTQLARSLAEADRRARAVAVVDIRLTNYEALTTLDGQDGCDTVLRMIAKRLRQRVRPGDHVGRLDSDRFLLIMPDLDNEVDTAARIRDLVAQLASPVAFNDAQRPVKLTAGISRYPQDANSASALLECARSALRYAAHRASACNFYSRKTHAALSRRHDLMHRLAHALEVQGLQQVYQPIIDCRSGRIVGVEALARWHDTVYGPISPGEFIPLSEADTDMRQALTRWSLATACRQIAHWERAEVRGLSMAVNIPGAELYREDFAELIHAVLSKYRVAPNQLVLELTEQSLITHVDAAAATIRALRKTGVRFAIDDFGTGYSSLSYLKQLPLDSVKIDRSFIHDITTDRVTRELTRGILDLARALNLSVVAEGIETADQHTLLKRLNCPYVQGYLFSRPVSATAIADQRHAF